MGRLPERVTAGAGVCVSYCGVSCRPHDAANAQSLPYNATVSVLDTIASPWASAADSGCARSVVHGIPESQVVSHVSSPVSALCRRCSIL